MPCSDTERNKCLYITQALTIAGHDATRADKFRAALTAGGDDLAEVIGQLVGLDDEGKELVRQRIRDLPDDEVMFFDAFRAIASDPAHPVLVVTLGLAASSSLTPHPLGEPGDAYLWLSLR
ncbi:MAG: hypothetical protein V9G19_23865 [Tetrasphaera sp.]